MACPQSVVGAPLVTGSPEFLLTHTEVVTYFMDEDLLDLSTDALISASHLEDILPEQSNFVRKNGKRAV